MRRLQDNWPEANLTWIIGKTEAALMADIPGVEFIIFDKSAGRDAYQSVREQLAGKSFDVALCMHASMRVNRLYRSINAPVRLGFDFRRAAMWNADDFTDKDAYKLSSTKNWRRATRLARLRSRRSSSPPTRTTSRVSQRHRLLLPTASSN